FLPSCAAVMQAYECSVFNSWMKAAFYSKEWVTCNIISSEKGLRFLQSCFFVNQT
ncbi:hypothetical protein Tsp_14925, partial [Trichinella spiralis]|uniref:hypothetical protein n=1 Tax=Trichinella spiralis TaxID=6334 RepID=UPI0001EFDADD